MASMVKQQQSPPQQKKTASATAAELDTYAQWAWCVA